MGKVIGFGGTMYTLWSIEKSTEYATNSQGQHYPSYERCVSTYFQNISKDINKVIELYPDLDIDMELKGNSSFTTRIKITHPTHLFQFGKFEGSDISKCDDVWQLERLLDGNDKRRAVLGRNRLIELGQIVKYKHDVKEYYYDGTGEDTFVVKTKNYIFKKDLIVLKKREAEAKAFEESTFLHNEGDKVTLVVKEVSWNSFSSNFGMFYIIGYETEQCDKYWYKGSKPLSMEDNVFYTIKATIKHSVYNEQKQTILQRIKAI